MLYIPGDDVIKMHFGEAIKISIEPRRRILFLIMKSRKHTFMLLQTLYAAISHGTIHFSTIIAKNMRSTNR